MLCKSFRKVLALVALVAVASLADEDDILHEKAVEMAEEALAESDADLRSDEAEKALAEAEAMLRKAAELAPDKSKHALMLAELQLQVSDLKAAGVTYAAAAERWPDEASAHYGLGMVHGLQRKYEAAASSLQRAVELEPSNGDMQQALGSTLANLGLNHEGKLALARGFRHGNQETKEETLEQLWTLWKRERRIPLDDITYQQALRHEEWENPGPLRDVLEKIRSREVEPEWLERLLMDCADSSDDRGSPCALNTVMNEAFVVGWDSARKLSRSPYGGHAVINGGLGALCAMALHSGASSCTNVDPLCDAKEEGQKLFQDSSFSPEFLCRGAAENLTELAEASIVWVVDGGWDATSQNQLEHSLAQVLRTGALVVLFRNPTLQHTPPVFQPVSHSTLELFCTVWNLEGDDNWICGKYRPALSWEDSRNTSVFVLERLDGNAPRLHEDEDVLSDVGQAGTCENSLRPDCQESSKLCSVPVTGGDLSGRPLFNASALPHGSTASWCGELPILLIDDFILPEELSSLELDEDPFQVGASMLGPGFEFLTPGRESCYHNWQLGAADRAGDSALAPVRQRMSDLLGTDLGFDIVNVGWCDRVRNMHHDRSFYPQRSVTILVYLSDVQGGETLFPLLQRPDRKAEQAESSEEAFVRKIAVEHLMPQTIGHEPEQQILSWARGANAGFADVQEAVEALCARPDDVFAVAPKAGRAVVFWHDAGRHAVWDNVHAPCQISGGRKWTIQRFAEHMRP